MNGFLRWLMALEGDDLTWRKRMAALEPPIMDGEGSPPRAPRLRVIEAEPDGRERLTRPGDLAAAIAKGLIAIDVTLMRGSGHYDL